MKDIFVRLFLLNIYIYKVLSQPYLANSAGKCLNPSREYKLDGSNLCCNRCKPGHRLKQECSNNTDTKCEPCPKGQFIESWNYSPNCFPCKKCKSDRGLQYLQNCTSSISSKCGCQPDMFCIMGFEDPYCELCTPYKTCKAGYGVSKPGTAKSDVTCEQCPDGTFSDTVSNTDRCRPHTNCHGRVVKSGNTTADAVCQPGKFQTNILSQTSTKEPLIETEFATLNKRMISFSESEATLGPRLAVSDVVFNQSTKSPPTRTEFGSQLGMETAATIACVIGVLFILITLLFCWKTTCMKDAARFHQKIPVDSNGNCEIGDKINGGYLGETQVMSLTITSPEQQFLLEKGELCSDQIMTTNNPAAFTRTDDCSSYESIGPLQSTTALHSINSALSEPMILLSSTESGPPQNEIHRQSSSQPTSPEIISPVTTSSHVNVNITVHIGNGSGRTPTVLPTDTVQVDSELPFGEEEESFSMPQQEAGKQSVMAVQEGSA